MALFNDRRSTLVDVVNPAEVRRASLARPDKPGQASRAYITRTQRVHNDVMAGHAAVYNPVPPVVQQAVSMFPGGQTVLPTSQSRRSRLAGSLRSLGRR